MEISFIHSVEKLFAKDGLEIIYVLIVIWLASVKYFLVTVHLAARKSCNDSLPPDVVRVDMGKSLAILLRISC